MFIMLYEWERERMLLALPQLPPTTADSLCFGLNWYGLGFFFVFLVGKTPKCDVEDVVWMDDMPAHATISAISVVTVSVP